MVLPKQHHSVAYAFVYNKMCIRDSPSIIYGLVGMLVFSQALGFQTCLLSGSLTLVVMNLPTIITAMASPMARPMPSTTPAAMPLLACLLYTSPAGKFAPEVQSLRACLLPREGRLPPAGGRCHRR